MLLEIFFTSGRKYKAIVLAHPIQVIINKNEFYDKNINRIVDNPAAPNSLLKNIYIYKFIIYFIFIFQKNLI